MGLVVVGAAGRMGQTLIRTIAAIERSAGSPARSSGPARRLSAAMPANSAGVGPLGVADHRRSAAGLRPGRRRARLHHAGRDRRIRRLCRAGASSTSSARPAARAEDDAKIAAAARHATIVKSGNMSLGVNLLAVLVEQAARALRARRFRHRDSRNASPPQGRRALRHGAAARPGGGRRPRHRARRAQRARRATATPARAPGTIGFATLRGGSVVGDHSVILAGERRAHRAVAPCRGPRPSSPAARSRPRSGRAAANPASTPCATCWG